MSIQLGRTKIEKEKKKKNTNLNNAHHVSETPLPFSWKMMRTTVFNVDFFAKAQHLRRDVSACGAVPAEPFEICAKCPRCVFLENSAAFIPPTHYSTCQLRRWGNCVSTFLSSLRALPALH